MSDSDHDERINDLENIHAEVRLLNIEKDINKIHDYILFILNGLEKNGLIKKKPEGEHCDIQHE